MIPHPNEIFYNVWLLARPLSHTSLIPPLASLSDGKYPLCHWGALITELSVNDIEEHFENRYGSPERNMGTLYALHRAENQYSANILPPFLPSNLQAEWRRISTTWLTVTTKSSEASSTSGTR